MRNKFIAVGAVAIAALACTVAALTSASGAPPANPSRAQVVPANLPSGGHEQVYTTVAPCRVVDTRASVAGQLVSNVRRDFYVGGTFGFAPQGGQSGGCNIPPSATAVTANISATGVVGGGYLRAWAYGTTEPTAIALLLQAGPGTFTGATIPVNSSRTSVKTVGGSARFVMDVTGYYSAKIYAVSMSTASIVASSRIVGISHTTGTGFYTLTADANVSTCAISVSSFATNQAAGYASGNSIYVQTANGAGTAGDFYFQVDVTC